MSDGVHKPGCPLRVMSWPEATYSDCTCQPAATATTPTVPPEVPKLWRAVDLRPAAQPRWLAKSRIPRAAVTILVGDEGIGKSLLWVWIIAAVTTGKALPEFGIPARRPSYVVIVVTEDDWSTTVRPRLELAGADLNQIGVICTEDDGSGSPIFPRDLDLIGKAQIRPAMVVVDAWLDTVGAGLVVKDPQQARQALHPWTELATKTDAAVLLLTHTNRVATGTARDKYGITSELRKKARMTLFAQQDDDGHLLVGPEKANTTSPVPASMFTIDPVAMFPPTEDHDGTVPLLRHIGESAMTAREHITESFAAEHDNGGDELAQFLTELLDSAGGKIASKDALKALREAGLPTGGKALDRAKRTARIVSGKDKGSLTGGWTWYNAPHEESPKNHNNHRLSDGDSSVILPSGHLAEVLPIHPGDDEIAACGHPLSAVNTRNNRCALCILETLEGTTAP